MITLLFKQFQIVFHKIKIFFNYFVESKHLFENNFRPQQNYYI